MKHTCMNALSEASKRLPEIEANRRKTVLETCRGHKIDISTRRLIRTIESETYGRTISILLSVIVIHGS